MAAFEKDHGSRRFYSLANDSAPVHSGGIPTGSVWIHTDTDDRFIYDGQSRQWLPFVGIEDVVEVLSGMEDVLHDLLREAKVTRAAVATMANDQSGGDYTTDDE